MQETFNPETSLKPDIITCDRVGQGQKNKPRPIKVKMNLSENLSGVLRKSEEVNCHCGPVSLEMKQVSTRNGDVYIY